MTRVKQSVQAGRVYSATVDRTGGVICDQKIHLTCFYGSKGYREHFLRSLHGPRLGQDADLLDQQHGDAALMGRA